LQRGYGNRYVQDVIDASLQHAIDRSRHGGRPLDHSTAAELGGALGRDVSQVRVHDDDQADRLSRSLDAAAFTIGRDIFFRARHYDPGTTPGRRLLAHELAHVVQQEAGPRSAHRYHLTSAGDPGEHAADRAAQDIVLGGRARPMAVRPLVPLIQRKAFIGPDALSARPVEFGDSPPRMARGPRRARKEGKEPRGPDQDLKEEPGRVRERSADQARSRKARPQADDLPRVRKRPGPVNIPPGDSFLGSGDRNLALVLKDYRSRYFRSRAELYRFAAGKTDDIGYVDREKVWVRLPDEFLVLGESHTRTTVMDLVEATGVTDYIYEGGETRPSPYLYAGKQTRAMKHQLEELLPKFIVGLVGVQHTLKTELRDLDLEQPSWKKDIRDERLTAERTDPEAEKQEYHAKLAQWSSDWEAKYRSRDERGERKLEPSGGGFTGQHKSTGELHSPAPDTPYDRSKTEVKATLRVLLAIRDTGAARGSKDPIARFYAQNQPVIDKTIKQLEAGLPVRLTRMFLKMATGKFDLQALIDHLNAAAVQERADLNVASVQTYQSYTAGKFGSEAQAEELRDSYMLHRIIEAKASGHRLAGLGDAHRKRLQPVLAEIAPDIVVQSSETFYLDQYRLHPDRD